MKSNFPRQATNPLLIDTWFQARAPALQELLWRMHPEVEDGGMHW